ncbi:hypothetical protein Tco_0132496 [Tanacetum coccineum]
MRMFVCRRMQLPQKLLLKLTSKIQLQEGMTPNLETRKLIQHHEYVECEAPPQIQNDGYTGIEKNANVNRRNPRELSTARTSLKNYTHRTMAILITEIAKLKAEALQKE